MNSLNIQRLIIRYKRISNFYIFALFCVWLDVQFMFKILCFEPNLGFGRKKSNLYQSPKKGPRPRGPAPMGPGPRGPTGVLGGRRRPVETRAPPVPKSPRQPSKAGALGGLGPFDGGRSPGVPAP